MRARGTAGLAVATVAMLGIVAVIPAHAQTGALGGFNLEGGVEAGIRLLPNEPPKNERAKLDEYRDVSSGAFLAGLELRIFSPEDSFSTELSGRHWGYRDQEFGIGTGRLGLWEFGFGWDQAPHILSTTGRSLATEVADGVFTLPTPRPPSLTTYNAAPAIEEIGVRWDTARVFFKLAPTPDLDLGVEYTRIHKHGTRPFSLGFGGFGTNFVEVLEPVNQTMHDVRLRGTWAKENWQLQAGYTFSMFQNGNRTVTADNPCFGLNPVVSPLAGGCGTDAAAAPPTGLSTLAPDNMAHAVFVQGGLNLPLRTRVTGNFSYGLQLQDESFVAQTVNPGAATAPNAAALALPARSLGGDVRTTLFNIGVTTRALDPLALTVKYRFFDYDDRSSVLGFPGQIVNDRLPISVPGNRAARPSYTKENADLDGRVVVVPSVGLTLGTGWERWDRSAAREVRTSDEVYAKAAVDASPFDWLLARLTYKPSVRRTDRYDTFAPAAQASSVAFVPPPPGSGQSTLFRKFDEAERDRQRMDLLVQLSPLDTLSLGPFASWRYDDYLHSALGLQHETSIVGGIDLAWSPFERLTLAAAYTHEISFQQLHSRLRPVDVPNFDWVSEMTDTVDTVVVNANVGLVPRVLTWTAGASFSTATGRVETRNPNGAPTAGSGAQNEQARAAPWPAFEDTLLRLDTTLSYRFWKQWSANLGYAFETFAKKDWRTDTLNPFVPGVGAIWLGNDARDYTAHIVGLTLGYQFR